MMEIKSLFIPSRWPITLKLWRMMGNSCFHISGYVCNGVWICWI